MIGTSPAWADATKRVPSPIEAPANTEMNLSGDYLSPHQDRVASWASALSDIAKPHRPNMMLGDAILADLQNDDGVVGARDKMKSSSAKSLEAVVRLTLGIGSQRKRSPGSWGPRKIGFPVHRMRRQRTDRIRKKTLVAGQ